jgi:hypothetical protein
VRYSEPKSWSGNGRKERKRRKSEMKMTERGERHFGRRRRELHERKRRSRMTDSLGIHVFLIEV